MHIDIDTCIYAYLHIYKCIYIYTCIYYIFTYIFTYLYFVDTHETSCVTRHLVYETSCVCPWVWPHTGFVKRHVWPDTGFVCNSHRDWRRKNENSLWKYGHWQRRHRWFCRISRCSGRWEAHDSSDSSVSGVSGAWIFSYSSRHFLICQVMWHGELTCVTWTLARVVHLFAMVYSCLVTQDVSSYTCLRWYTCSTASLGVCIYACAWYRKRWTMRERPRQSERDSKEKAIDGGSKREIDRKRQRGR